ncbi:MAG: hypothetical protein LBS96_06040 [Oscillospiraceae bacterium]|jgi:hypothetical protein|nr:hypothetical protein [Oscillospiraceae bacterium]
MKKTNGKKILSVVLALATLAAMMSFGGAITASAATVSVFPIKAYPRFAGKTYATNGTSWVGENDLCTIKSISGNSCTVEYPLDNGGSVTRTFDVSTFFNSKMVVNGNIAKSATVYRRSDSSSTLGSVNTTGDTSVWILGTAGNRKQIIYKVTNASYYKMGWVPSDAVREQSGSTPIPTPTPTPTSPASVAVASRLNTIANTSGYRNGTKYVGSAQCKGFANTVFNKLFGGTLPSTENSLSSSGKAYAYKVESNSNVSQVGQLNGKYTGAQLKSLMSNARPGDVLQVSKAKNSGAHTYVIIKCDSAGIYVYDANYDGNNTIRYNVKVAYDYIASIRLGGATLYTAKNYK